MGNMGSLEWTVEMGGRATAAIMAMQAPEFQSSLGESQTMQSY